MTQVSKADYLKKYLEPVKKKRRKKRTADGSAPPKKVVKGLRIVDQDFVAPVKTAVADKDEEEYQPVVVEEVDEQKMAAEKAKATADWVVIQDDGGAILSRGGRGDDDDYIKKEDYGTLSPPRRGRHDTPSPTLSPPRRGRHDTPSPPRRARHDTPSPTLSPPRRGRHDTPSPPRRGRHDTPSPPRASIKAEPVSPPRRGASQDISPPRKRARAEDLSPPRKAAASQDLSPPRKRARAQEDLSPPRKRDADLSPPRKGASTGDLSPPRKKAGAEGGKEEKDQSKVLRLPALKPGLSTGKEFAQHEKAVRKTKEEYLHKMDPEKMGKGAETVYRDRHGRKLEMLSEFMRQDEENKTGQKQEPEMVMEWGKGLVQKKEVEDKKKRLEDEKSKPFARTAEDEDLNAFYKSKDRWGDPMAALLEGGAEMTAREEKKKKKKSDKKDKKKRKKEKKKEKRARLNKKPAEPTVCKFRAPPNRFNIPPGPYWDGVDRSNGFEKSYFNKQSANVAQANAAYLWSVEDM